MAPFDQNAFARPGYAAGDEPFAAVDLFGFSQLRRSVRCFVPGASALLLPRPHNVEFVPSASEAYDVILCPRNDGSFERFVAAASHPAAPLIAFSDSFGARADRVLTEVTAEAIAGAIAALAPLIARLAALPRLPAGADRNGLLALTLAATRERAIAPEWSPARKQGVDYPLLAGIPEPRPLLEELAEAGLLRRRFFDRTHVCAHCDSARLHAREVCAACQSSHLGEHAIVHHYPCAFQGAQPLFEDGGGYRCPKCRKQLRHYGVDYDKPGTVFTCHACGAANSEPGVAFVCADCGKQTPADRAARRDWYAYELLPDGIACVNAGELPRSDLVRPDGQGFSFRDFKLVVRQQLRIAARCRRPLALLRVEVDEDALMDRVGPNGFGPVSRLLRDLVGEVLNEGDAVAAHGGSILACLPECGGRQAQALVAKLSRRIDRVAGPRLPLRIEAVEGAAIEPLLNGLP